MTSNKLILTTPLALFLVLTNNSVMPSRGFFWNPLKKSKYELNRENQIRENQKKLTQMEDNLTRQRICHEKKIEKTKKDSLGFLSHPMKSYQLHQGNKKLEEMETNIKIQRANQQWNVEKAGREIEIDSFLIAVNTTSFVSMCLLFKGGMALPCLLSGMFSIKLLSILNREYPYDVPNDSTMFKASINMFFSGAAFCFSSRSMELVGGTSLLFIQLMTL